MTDHADVLADARALKRACARAEQTEQDARRMGDQRRRWEEEGTRLTCARDVDLSAWLEADTHILAASDSIPGNVIEIATQLCTVSGLGLIIRSKAELLP
jgi:hypothetical protein